MKRNQAEIPPAMFHLENIHGPLLLLGADDDQLWNSDAQSEMALSYLRAHHHPYADQYLHYPHAGHLFLFQSASYPQTQVPLGPFMLMLGGSARGDLAAQAQAGPRSVRSCSRR